MDAAFMSRQLAINTTPVTTAISVTSFPRPEPTSLASPVKVNETTYASNYWPHISEFVRLVLQSELQAITPLHTFSHEELYRSIYWVCWQGFSKTLYNDLATLTIDTLGSVERGLNRTDNTAAGQEGQDQDITAWTEKFARVALNHERAVEVLGSVFAYLDRTYVEFELHQRLRDMLVGLFYTLVVIPSELRILHVLCIVAENPASATESVVRLVQTLYRFDPDNAYLNPSLFQALCGFATPPNFADICLKHSRLEAQMMLLRGAITQGDNENPHLKRPLEREAGTSGNSMFVEGKVDEDGVEVKRERV